jgi:catechol 2,3-dioxygenase-like lactoylglutathione lyase family enzyme
MIDHLSVGVTDFERAVAFYKAALAPLGYGVLMAFPDSVGIGPKGGSVLWIARTDQPIMRMHIALRAGRPQIDAFHAAALAAGGSDNGAPGLRPDYHRHYYAAYVRDPDGHNIEAVCHDAPGAPKAGKPAARAKAKVKTKAAAKVAAKAPASKGAAAKAKAKAKPKPKRR